MSAAAPHSILRQFQAIGKHVVSLAYVGTLDWCVPLFCTFSGRSFFRSHFPDSISPHPQSLLSFASRTITSVVTIESIPAKSPLHASALAVVLYSHFQPRGSCSSSSSSSSTSSSPASASASPSTSALPACSVSCDADILHAAPRGQVTALGVCSESARIVVAAGAALTAYDCRPLAWRRAPVPMAQFEAPFGVVHLRYAGVPTCAALKIGHIGMNK